MLLIFTVLAFLLANVASSALPEDVLSAFEELNSYGGKLVWSDELENKALEYLTSPETVKANLVIGEEMFIFSTIPKGDSSLSGMDIYNAFRELFETEGTKISALPEGSKYGCNFQNIEEVLKIACLYNEK
ncbi:unnamed protein product [Haemonchus placei]|uniref:Secreted protein n=1 Tax=Haemonchus placei TaxID=6290 RepID=A0A0N4WGF1_HAEPC|nr:unnamed protein product [Haemonchus placei]